jgi:O-antigen/teichoic acid export membrane protein
VPGRRSRELVPADPREGPHTSDPQLERDDELDTKIMRGSAWAVLGYGGTNALSLVTTIVLARLLVPADFGLVALALAVLAVAYLAQESGLGAALVVHRGDLRPAAASAMVFSPVVASGLYAAAFVLAPVLADIFDEPRLTDVLRVMALVLVIRGFSIMPIALLQRAMRFGPITAIELAGGVAQLVTAVTLAVAGAGVWSLVAGHLAFAGAQTFLAWCLSPLRPSPWEARRETLRELMRYGRHVGLANIINYGNKSAEGLIVGRALGAAALGFYTIAVRLASLPVQVIGNVLGRGVFAALAQVRENPPAFRRIWLDNVQRVALLGIPSTIGLFLVAEPLVIALLGETWQPAVTALQILALNGVVRTFSATSGEVFQALHRPQLRVIAETAHFVLVVPALIVAARWHGIEGAAAAVVLVNVAIGVPVVVGVMRLLGATARDLGAVVLRPAVGWVLLTITLLALRPLVDGLPAGLELIALVTAEAAVYAVAVALFARDVVVTMWLSLRGAQPSQRPPAASA